MKTILGYIRFLLIKPTIWFIVLTKKQRCIICLGLFNHECLECGEIISRKMCKKNGGYCRRCEDDIRHI